ncbi:MULTISPECIES: exodeoxyribonuclease III [Legionella]|uniref:Exodeoxyribonuclease III n=1 Tax=Legionella septentrionalis TaxID=2498109 RepID=A0A3S0XT21_9GAMM|nr:MULTISPECIES: exodeoxyribonuclease III [Legionella]MCP0913734.1 exodeoxyribonuclease III [Legionella sp. 27cVA30]RUQ85403.1 exodeoxyribonuclease III [Legionella septentrionalis]RUQ99317.1 exodeoxyribonuclease III [Legionella septentrionalis]RUR09630.1 exodeoxyribonuclease III [Legionella septentrionalis]RUR14794.1 exodeoxyribonuclease III [Legionella septentrionalis]
MKIISFNANGIRSAARKGFYDWLHKQEADFVCIQETKAQTEQLKDDPLYYPCDYFCDYFDAVKKGYSGVAIYARQKPQQVVKGLGFPFCDEEGRYIQFDYPKFSIISLYMPSGTSGEVRQSIKFDFLVRFARHLQELKKTGKELIICGDYNIAHKKIDLKNWRGNQKNSGFLPEERAWMDELFSSMGFFDAFRLHNQEEEQYTWWSNRGRAWEKNVGWRIDYQVITAGLVESIAAVDIYRATRFSDHAPLTIEYHGEWYA